jgi:NhaA family Na+:H+ antiporter
MNPDFRMREAGKSISRRLIRPLEAFFRTEALGGTILILATISALWWANSDLAPIYEALWTTPFTIGTPDFALTKPLILWVNDFLMAIFFLLVGLEIKRELLLGELNSMQKALLPVIAAIGGLILPALIFASVARDPPANRGWGVPMATDIAFALGCLRLLGKRVPSALIVILTALAIIDDLGAIIVIAIFYTSSLSFGALLIALVVVVVLAAMNAFGIRRPSLYILVGLPLWVAILKSGIHATIAGVLVGLAVPARAQRAASAAPDAATRGDGERADAFEDAPPGLEHSESPLARLEHALHPWVAFGIMPIFAIANAGISFKGVSLADVLAPASLGVLLGLFVGKQVGIFGAVAIAVRAKVATLPSTVSWRHIYGLSALAGIGFTMSLFIAGLAFGEGTTAHLHSKLGIIAGSALAAVVGMIVLGSRSSGSDES